MSDEVSFRGLMRTSENGSRRSRTLMLDDGTAQVQAKEATLGYERYLVLRYWTEEANWSHLLIDPTRGGLAGVLAMGHGETEKESWEMTRLAASVTADVEL